MYWRRKETMKKIALIFLLSFGAVPSFAQDTTGTVVILSDKVGAEIDLAERNHYRLFLGAKDFHSAVLIQEPDSTYRFKITSKQEAEPQIKVSWISCTREEVERIHRYIETGIIRIPDEKPLTTEKPGTALVEIKAEEYGKLDGVDAIYVRMKDGTLHEVTGFQFTETHLVGKEKAGPFNAALSDVLRVSMKGRRDSNRSLMGTKTVEQKAGHGGSVLGAFIGAVGFGALAFIPSCAFSMRVANETGSSDAGTALFFGLEIGAMVLGGHLGYHAGGTDEPQTVDEILDQQGREETEKDKKDEKKKE